MPQAMWNTIQVKLFQKVYYFYAVTDTPVFFLLDFLLIIFIQIAILAVLFFCITFAVYEDSYQFFVSTFYMASCFVRNLVFVVLYEHFCTYLDALFLSFRLTRAGKKFIYQIHVVHKTRRDLFPLCYFPLKSHHAENSPEIFDASRKIPFQWKNVCILQNVVFCLHCVYFVGICSSAPLFCIHLFLYCVIFSFVRFTLFLSLSVLLSHSLLCALQIFWASWRMNHE